MSLAEKVVDKLLERDSAGALRKSLFARAIRLFDDGYTPEDIYTVLKDNGGAEFNSVILRAWEEFRRRGVS